MTDASYWNGKGDFLTQAVGSPDSGKAAFLSKNTMWRSGCKVTRGRNARRLKFIAILGATLLIICGISGWIGWATTSVRPVTHTVISLVSTDYHDNDSIQPGLYADRAVGRLAALCSESGEANESGKPRLLLRMPHAPVEFLGADAIDGTFPESGKQPFVLYVAAHGISSPTGPVLLPKGAISSADGVSVKEIIRRFGECEADTPKALILDAGAIASDHRWGILHNDFAYQVRVLNDEILAIPNLTVIIDSDVDQRSWANPGSGVTVFGEAVIAGLRESTVDEDQDGWLDLWDLFLSCEKKMDKWVSAHTSYTQAPVLLPLGDEGKRRARRSILRPTSKESLPEPPTLISASRNEMVDLWWQSYESLNQRTPHPALTTPLLWDRFVAAVLRFEHFEMNGSRAAADWLNDQLQRMKYQLDSGRPIESTAARAGLVSPLAVGMIPPSNSFQDANTLAEHLMSTSPASRAEAWQAAAGSIDNAYATAHLRREVVALIVASVSDSLRTSQSVDRNMLADAAAAILATQDPLQPTSTLSTLSQLLSRDLPENFQSKQDALRLSRLLELWSRCDRVTTPRSMALLPLEPCVLPWVETMLQQGDKQRRLAFDLLMGDEESRVRADKLLERAEQYYDQVDDMAKVVAAAQTRLRVGWNRLAWLTAAIESRSGLDAGLDETDKLIVALGKAYDAAAKLAARLAVPVNIDEASKEQTCNLILSLDSQFQHAFETVSVTLSNWQSQDLSSKNLCDLVSALSQPVGTGPQRRVAWERCRQEAIERSGGDSRVERAPDVSKLACLIGELALSSWTQQDFDRLVPAKSVSYAQVSHQLDILAVDPNWRTILCDIGHQIAGRYQLARESLEVTARTATEIDQNDSLARRLDILLPDEAFNTIDRRRHSTVLDYLVANTKRGIADCLASVDQQAMPQFARLSALMVDDISRYAEGDEVKVLHQLVIAASSLDLQAPSKIDWTTEQDQSVQVDLVRQQDPNPGFVTITATTHSPFDLLHPRTDERLCRPIRTSERSTDPVAPAMLDSTLLQIRLDRSKSNLDQLQTSDIQVRGYFRGRKLDANVNVCFHAEPSHHLIARPIDDRPQVAVRSPFDNQSAAPQGAIAIVLDCSGSMGAAQGQDFDESTKYAQALNALEMLLHELPAGVRLSIWTFGQAGSPQKTVVPAEQSIRQVLAPVLWNPRSSETIKRLIDKLSYPISEPWNESPLVASMIAAARDFSDQQDAFRSVVVITDGFDNRIQADSVNNPQGTSAEDVIRRSFANTGIVVNVIGFRVDGKDVQRTEDSLSVVTELLPPGRYVKVDHAEDLIAALRSCLASDVHYEIRKYSDLRQSEAKPVIVTESPSQGAIRWSNADLQPGTYEIRCVTNEPGQSPVTATIELRAGDQLLLQRTKDRDLIVCPDSPTASLLGQHRSTNEFDLDLIPVVSNRFGSTSRALRIQRKYTRPLAIQPPNDVWVTVNEQSSPVSVRWNRVPERPGCEYRIDTLSTITSTENQILNVCITNESPAPVGKLIRNRDFKHFADLAPATFQDSAGVVKLVEAKIESWVVPDASGVETQQSCLVLRITCPDGAMFRLRPLGLNITGYDEQYFSEANAYTYRAWPMSEADVEQSLQAIELISMNQVVESAKRSGMIFDFQLDYQVDQKTVMYDNLKSPPQL